MENCLLVEIKLMDVTVGCEPRRRRFVGAVLSVLW